MTYHYSQNTGIIYTHSHKFTQPITNLIYNIIVKEAQQLGLHSELSNPDKLTIYNNQLRIYFNNDHIKIVKWSYQPKTTIIPYEQYTTLKQLIATHDIPLQPKQRNNLHPSPRIHQTNHKPHI